MLLTAKAVVRKKIISAYKPVTIKSVSTYVEGEKSCTEATHKKKTKYMIWKIPRFFIFRMWKRSKIDNEAEKSKLRIGPVPVIKKPDSLIKWPTNTLTDWRNMNRLTTMGIDISY